MVECRAADRQRQEMAEKLKGAQFDN